ncbi:zinc ribbon domain-containing protein [Paenibacillus lignilyticus]|uniref:Nucleic acid-binding protein n=1 Tax=Paenibacillus lignilyticus TaxID=1172615 RepID=A0ABS5C9Y1_9BACL|nr:zinc ribbon domain-containing protein [Paenibacillus lignilyticus]MBP3962812.1 hypothetical protein [Paenibacillus lignilyticus]
MSEKGCIKCGSRDAKMKDIAIPATGFAILPNQFIVVSCNNCGYSEFYNKKVSSGSNVLDYFFS